jgi:DNA-binding FrmR family transcriptional regulator
MNKSISEKTDCCSVSPVGASKIKATKKKTKDKANPDHSSQLIRLNRVIGQMEGVKRMIESQRYCPEILTQTRAASSALRAVEMEILEKHIRHCVSEALTTQQPGQMERKVKELISVLDRF